MSAITRFWWYQRKLKTIHEIKEAIDSVTQEQVINVLRRFSPVKPLTIAGIGPLSEEELVGNTLSTLS
jgi:predicted Zn-dependent peptidase